MKPSVRVSLIAAVVATMGVGGIAKMVSASAPNTSSMAVAQEKVESRESSTDEASEIAKLQPLAKISASQAQQTAEAAQGNKASNVQLENEDGNLVYAVNIGQNEVKVDAGNGKILYTDTALSSYMEYTNIVGRLT